MPKKALREQYAELRHGEHAKWGANEQQALENHLFSIPSFSGARTLMLYASIRDEVPTHALMARLLAAGRHVVLPVAQKEDKSITPAYLSSMDDLSSGLFGVPEPKGEGRQDCEPSSIDVALIPALAFDLQGHRLGHGLGYYDRFLPKLSCPLIGLAYDAQIAPRLPREAHDHPVNFIVSEKRVVVCKRMPAPADGAKA